MTGHIIGWLVLAWTLGTGGFAARWLATHSTVPLSWEQRVPVPLVLELALSSGSDYVGFC